MDAAHLHMPRIEPTQELLSRAVEGADHRGVPGAVPTDDVDFSRDVVCILGLPFDCLRLDEAAALVVDAATSGTRCFISTPNINFLMLAQRRPAFRQSVLVSDLSLADGTPLIWIARLLDLPLPERVAGSDLFDRLKAMRSDALRVYFFGGPAGAARKARRRLNATSKGMRAVGDRSPGFESVETLSSAAHIDDINASGANFLAVSLGAEKGQAWIERNRHRLAAPVIVHLGAVVNFVAGRVARAPMWMRQVGLEWVWRVGREPVLWRRYAQDASALGGLMVTHLLPLWRLQSRMTLADAQTPPTWTLHDLPVADPEADADAGAESTEMSLHGAFIHKNLQPLRDALATAARLSRTTVLHLDDVERIDAAAMGLLLLLEGHLASRGHALRLVGAKSDVGAVMRYSGLGHLTGP